MGSTSEQKWFCLLLVHSLSRGFGIVWVQTIWKKNWYKLLPRTFNSCSFNKHQSCCSQEN